MWLILSCVIVLAECRESLGLLIAWMNFGDGVELSIECIRFPRSDSRQRFAHLFLVAMLCFCFTAEVLVASRRRRMRGRSDVAEVRPSAAFFASVSASSLPCIPMCPAVQRRVSEYLLVPHFFLIFAAVVRKSAARYCPGWVSSVSTAFTAARLSAPIAKDVLPACSALTSWSPSRSPTSSAS